ncbi:hypothetical protein VNO80_13184 [Phaseolus coccineus]|uniref:Uncharacterized protein n=1 Tax=Phaseolus coccineus TaxID=3886 RepID=A0AAN9R9Q6_PHACN
MDPKSVLRQFVVAACARPDVVRHWSFAIPRLPVQLFPSSYGKLLLPLRGALGGFELPLFTALVQLVLHSSVVPAQPLPLLQVYLVRRRLPSGDVLVWIKLLREDNLASYDYPYEPTGGLSLSP